MAHDPSNPFQRMAKALSARKGDKDSPASSSVSRPSGGKGNDSRASAAKRSAVRRDGCSVPDDDDDTSLFLDAMSGALPMPGKGMRELAPAQDRQRGARPGARQSYAVRDVPASAPAGLKNGSPDFQTASPGQALAALLRQTTSPSSRTAATPERTAKATSEQTAPSCRIQDNPADKGSFEDMHAAFMSAGGQAAPEAAHIAKEEDALFAKAMQGVTPVTTKGRDVPLSTKKSRTMPSVDPAKALRDLLEGRLEFALCHTDEFMEGYVVGIEPMILTRLRAGQFSPEAHLDLHGQNATQALDSLNWFVKNAYQRGMRTVLVVTGRGKNSPDGVGVLRPLLQRWLTRDPFKRVVLAFCTAKSNDGGPGAIYVLLRKYKKSRGKIIWEHCPTHEDFPDV